jgi:hypothetical protein
MKTTGTLDNKTFASSLKVAGVTLAHLLVWMLMAFAAASRGIIIRRVTVSDLERY